MSFLFTILFSKSTMVPGLESNSLMQSSTELDFQVVDAGGKVWLEAGLCGKVS